MATADYNGLLPHESFAISCRHRLLLAASASNRSYNRRNKTFLNNNSAGANSNLATRLACAAYSVGPFLRQLAGRKLQSVSDRQRGQLSLSDQQQIGRLVI
jgi:hypothetical protein